MTNFTLSCGRLTVGTVLGGEEQQRGAGGGRRGRSYINIIYNTYIAFGHLGLEGLKGGSTLRASLSDPFLKTLPELVMPL